MTCAVCSVCLQFCPGASACDNYTVSRLRLVLLKRHRRLIAVAVFLDLRLPFCPTAYYSGDGAVNGSWSGNVCAGDSRRETIVSFLHRNVHQIRLIPGYKYTLWNVSFMGGLKGMNISSCILWIWAPAGHRLSEEYSWYLWTWGNSPGDRLDILVHQCSLLEAVMTEQERIYKSGASREGSWHWCMKGHWKTQRRGGADDKGTCWMIPHAEDIDD